MSDFWKKTILYLALIIIILVMLTARNIDNPIEVTVEDGSEINKSTCTNTFYSLKAATMQKELLDQQVLISAAGGRGEEAAAVGVQVNELKAMVKIFEDIITDPKLNCHQYLKDEPTTTHITI